jgi:hypothetical protein
MHRSPEAHRSSFVRGRTRPKSNKLGHVIDAATPGRDDVRWLDVAVDQAGRVDLAQRPADLPQQILSKTASSKSRISAPIFRPSKNP